MRTIDNIREYLDPLEQAIRNVVLPALLEGHKCNDEERSMALPPKYESP